MGQYYWTTEGLNWLATNDLEAATLYVGLIDADGYTAISPADTMSSHAGWSEESSYSESTRPQWVDLGASGGFLSNTPGATFTPTAAVNVAGFFLTTNSTKGGTTGTLLLVGLSDIGSVTRAIGAVLRGTIEVEFVSGGG